MVILRNQNKISDFLMILTWLCHFNRQWLIIRDSSFNVTLCAASFTKWRAPIDSYYNFPVWIATLNLMRLIYLSLCVWRTLLAPDLGQASSICMWCVGVGPPHRESPCKASLMHFVWSGVCPISMLSIYPPMLLLFPAHARLELTIIHRGR